MRHPMAVVGGRLLTDLADVTDDPGCLDSTGFWAVVLPYAGPPVFARFASVRESPTWSGRPWAGPDAGSWRTSLDECAFRRGVATIRAAIAAGDVYQVNLTRRMSAPLPAGTDVAALGAALAEGNPAPFSAVVRLPGRGIEIASASPELFLRRRGRVVESSPIKGTAATVDGFLPKDLAENVMIVDLVRNDLARVCVDGSVVVTALAAVEPHPGLYHLVSTVRGELAGDAGWPELLDATFPAGSITGAPKEAARRIIDELEPVPRGPYCGAIGWVDADRGEGELNVAIRTFWFDAGMIHFGTGGGITWGSDAAGEWAETELKARRLVALASGPPAGANR
ncbi:MAG TPA: anthranilate synthase component I family protein [Actinopolymorphaceae bacterium]